MSNKLQAQLDRIRALHEAATEGPWSWTHIGEKTNGYIIGTAYKEDGTAFSGFVEADEFFEDETILTSPIGELEVATCSYADPKFISDARTSVPKLERLVRAQARVIEALRADNYHDGDTPQEVRDERDESESALAELLKGEWE